MTSVFFYVNAGLYAGLTAVCTVKSAQTAPGTGFVELNRSGRSEYLVIYGGLQLGLALFYFVLARDPNYHRLGLLFSLLLYVPIVVYRIVTLLIYRPTSPVTLGTAALEIGLLLWAFVLWRTSRG